MADAVEECVSVLPEQVSALEEFIPIRQTSVTLMRATVSVPAAEYNLLHLLLPVLLGHKVQTTHTLSSYTCLAGVCVCVTVCVFLLGLGCADVCPSVPAAASSACTAAAV